MKLLLKILLPLALLAGGSSVAHAALIGHWTFDEASSGTGTGTVLDSTIGAHNGTINGGAQYVPGVVGSGALSFDGADDFVNFGLVPALDLTGGSYSIAFWTKLDTANVLGRIINMDDAADNSGGYSIFENNDSRIRITHNNGSFNDSGLATYPALSIGDWHHVGVVYDSTAPNITIYYDGTSQVAFPMQNPGDLTTDGDDPLYFGTYDGLNQMFQGSLDDVRMYDQALTGAEIGSLSAVPIPAAVWLFGSALGVLGVARRRQRQSATV